MPAVMHRGRRRAINEINMVPFIDVMLVVLIIFMVTATVITPGVINVPSAGKSSQPPDNYITVSVDAGRRLSSDSGKNTSEQRAANDAELVRHVKQALQAATPDTPVLIAADKDLPYHQVITLMSKLRDEAGAQRIALRVK